MAIETAGLETAFDVRCFVIPPDDLTNWEQLADQVIALTRVELDGRSQKSIYLCGESFGACIALKIMVQAPNLFKHFTLINSASSFHRVPWLTFGSLLFPWTPQLMYDISSSISLPFLAPLERLSPSGRHGLWLSTRDAPQHTAAQRLMLMRTFRIDESALHQITHPVLLIASQRDLLLPSVDEAQHLAKIFPNAQVITLPHSGHACLVEADNNLLTILKTTHIFNCS